jgi:glutaredoxin
MIDLSNSADKYLVYGTPGCGKCNMVKQALLKRGEDFEYRNLYEMSSKEQDELLELAKRGGVSTLPIIIKDSWAMTVQQVLTGGQH